MLAAGQHLAARQDRGAIRRIPIVPVYIMSKIDQRLWMEGNFMKAQKEKGLARSLGLFLCLSCVALVSCSGNLGSGSSGTSGSGTAVLSWTPPTTNTDSSPVDLAGFNIYTGTSAGNLRFLTTVSALDITTVVDNLATGTHFFAVTAVSVTGAESGFSNVESKTISPS